jgi:short-subunit dehydrogenase
VTPPRPEPRPAPCTRRAGASVLETGLGRALAKQLIDDARFVLVLTARSASTFRFEDEHISNAPNLWVRELELTDHQQMVALISEINLKLGGVDVLVNNAGVTERSTVEDSDTDSRKQQLDVNYLAPFDLITLILPLMRHKRRGQIIMAMPTMSAYSASKFALEAASEALWYEMRPWGIHITLIVPGFINSGGYLNTTETPRGRVIGRRNPPLRIHITREAWLLYWVRKLLPPTFYHWLVYRLLPGLHRSGAASA